MTTLAVTSVSSLLCHASTCFRIGSKLRCIRSAPTEMQSMSENDCECLASTGVNTPVTMLPNSGRREVQLPRSRLLANEERLHFSGYAIWLATAFSSRPTLGPRYRSHGTRLVNSTLTGDFFPQPARHDLRSALRWFHAACLPRLPA